MTKPKKDVVVVVVVKGDLREKIVNSQLELLKELPWQKDGCSLAYHTLIEYISVTDILQWNCSLAQTCLQAMNDRGLASEVFSSFQNKISFLNNKYLFCKGKLFIQCSMS